MASVARRLDHRIHGRRVPHDEGRGIKDQEHPVGAIFVVATRAVDRMLSAIMAGMPEGWKTPFLEKKVLSKMGAVVNKKVKEARNWPV